METNTTKYTSVCTLCYRQFEFTPEQAGNVVKCPDCATEVVLGSPPPVPEPIPEPTPEPTPKSSPRKPRRKLASAERIVLGLISAVAFLALVGTLHRPSEWFLAVMSSAFGALVIILYFAPALVGKDKHNSQAILALNFFLGWTLIGWIVALVWAATKDSVGAVTPETHVKCPYCAEPVRREATLCKHCHSKLSPRL